MHRRSPKWLDDMLGAGANIVEWTAELGAEDFARNRLVRDAVERNFVILGEALARIERADPDTVARIPEYRKIIGLRNVLAHGYDTTDHELIWTFARERMPGLMSVVRTLLTEAEAEFVDE